jgi:hypothetical protein
VRLAVRRGLSSGLEEPVFAGSVATDPAWSATS